MKETVSKFSKDAEKLGISETAVYLLRKFQAMHDDLRSLLNEKTNSFIRSSGRLTTSGGNAVEEIDLPGAKEAMQCQVQMHTLGASPVTILSAKAMKDKLIITFSADPSDDHVLAYFLTIKL